MISRRLPFLHLPGAIQRKKHFRLRSESYNQAETGAGALSRASFSRRFCCL